MCVDVPHHHYGDAPAAVMLKACVSAVEFSTARGGVRPSLQLPNNESPMNCLSGVRGADERSPSLHPLNTCRELSLSLLAVPLPTPYRIAFACRVKPAFVR